jgi:hypothetical protein
LLRRATWGRLVLLAAVAALLLAVTLLLLLELTRAGYLRRALLVLSVVAGIDRAENELQDPEIRSEVDGWVGTGHLGGLVLVVRCAVYHTSDNRIVVELAKELGGYVLLVTMYQIIHYQVIIFLPFWSFPTCANWKAMAPGPRFCVELTA